MITELTLKEAYTNWANKGPFKCLELASDGYLPWLEEAPQDFSQILDVAYITNRSGSKLVSPLVVQFLHNGSLQESDPSREIIARVILVKYLNNWTKLWGTYVTTYDPTDNYDVTETRTYSRTGSKNETASDTHTGTDTLQHGKTQSTTGTVSDSGSHTSDDTTTNNLTETVNHGKTQARSDSVYGFNSDHAFPSEESDITDGGTTTTGKTGTVDYDSTETDSNTRTHNLSVADSGSDVQTKNLTDSHTSGITSTDGGTESVRKRGNVGTSTYQRMIKEERALWIWNYFEQVFADVDKELVLQVHNAGL